MSTPSGQPMPISSSVVAPYSVPPRPPGIIALPVALPASTFHVSAGSAPPSAAALPFSSSQSVVMASSTSLTPVSVAASSSTLASSTALAVGPVVTSSVAIVAPVASVAPQPSTRLGIQCDVPCFRRGDKMNIECWIYKMEHYLRTVGKDESDDKRLWRQEMLVRVSHEHFDEVKSFVDLPYSDFLSRLRSSFAKPDLTQAYLVELENVGQRVDESVELFMVRVRELVDRAFPRMVPADRDR